MFHGVLAQVLDISSNQLHGNIYSLSAAIGLFELRVADNVSLC